MTRLGLGFKAGGYSFYYLDEWRSFSSDVDAVAIREVENVIESDEVFGWVSFAEARKLISNPFHRLFLLYDKGVVVASCWVQSGVINLDFLDIQAVLPRGAAYVTHVVVKAEYRGRGYSRYLLGLVSNKLQLEGVRRLYICCDNRNVSMRRVFGRLGFCYYYGVSYVRLLAMSFYWAFSESGCVLSFGKVNPLPEDVRFLERNLQDKDHS